MKPDLLVLGRRRASAWRLGALVVVACLAAACSPAPVVPPSPAVPAPTAALGPSATAEPVSPTVPEASAPTTATAPAFTPEPSPRPTRALPLVQSPSPAPALAPAPSPTVRVAAQTASPAPPRVRVVPSPSANPGPGEEVAALLVGPGQPGPLYALVKQGAGPLGAFPSGAVRLMVSYNYAVNWAPFPGGLPVAPDCMININLDYAVSEGLWASTCSGLYAWGPGGWVKRSDRVVDVVAVVYRPGAGASLDTRELWAAAHGDGVIHSLDGGRTWQDASAGLVSFGGLANLGIDPRDNATLYGIIRPKYAGSYLRRLTTGGQWQTMPAPDNNSTVETGMTIDGASGALYLTSQIAPYRLWRSPNPNATDLNQVRWELVHNFGSEQRVDLLASGWSPQGLALYATAWPLTPEEGGGASVGPPGFYRSEDGGQTWQPLATP